MKIKILNLLFVLSIISLIDIKAQPFFYFNTQLQDTTQGHLEKIVRYNLATNSVEDFIPQQIIGENAMAVWDPSQSYLVIEVSKLGFTLYDCLYPSTFYDLETRSLINEILYSEQRNKLYIFSGDYRKLSAFDFTVDSVSSELNLGKGAYDNMLIEPGRSSFISSDNDKIYFLNVDTNDVEQIWVYSLETNQITDKRDLSGLGYSGSDAYGLTFGRDGKGIITSGPLWSNPVKDFYYKLYDFDTDTSSPFIYHDGECEAYFSGNGEFILIFETYSDTLNDSLSYYHTGEVEIYNPGNGELVKTLTLPSYGIVYTFDNYPNNIYYAIDIEEPTRQIYILKMDSIFNVLDLTSLDPSSTVVNSPPFTLTVHGHGFDSLSTVYFNDTAKTTTYISDSVLTTDISTSDISVVGEYPVLVTDQWGISDTLYFSVQPEPPVLTSISPAIVLRYISGGSLPTGLTLTATGEFFTDSSLAYFNGNAKITTVVSDTVLTFPITGLEMSGLGNSSVWISSYGTNSDTLTFSVVDNLPQTLTPSLQCVHNNGGNSYTAYYGYSNNNSVSVYVPIGSKNKFAPSPIDRGQPRLFLTGAHTNVFSVNFNGKNLTWTLDQASVTANSGSIQCP